MKINPGAKGLRVGLHVEGCIRKEFLLAITVTFEFQDLHHDNSSNLRCFSRNRLIDGTEVIYETCERKQLIDESVRKGPDETPVGHHDCVTDIAMTRLPQNFLISGSKDGVIKVWK